MQRVGEGSRHKSTKSARWRLRRGPQASPSSALLLFWLEKMKAAAATKPWEQELELGTPVVVTLSSSFEAFLLHLSLPASPNALPLAPRLAPSFSSALHLTGAGPE